MSVTASGNDCRTFGVSDITIARADNDVLPLVNTGRGVLRNAPSDSQVISNAVGVVKSRFLGSYPLPAMVGVVPTGSSYSIKSRVLTIVNATPSCDDECGRPRGRDDTWFGSNTVMGIIPGRFFDAAEPNHFAVAANSSTAGFVQTFEPQSYYLGNCRECSGPLCQNEDQPRGVQFVSRYGFTTGAPIQALGASEMVERNSFVQDLVVASVASNGTGRLEVFWNDYQNLRFTRVGPILTFPGTPRALDIADIDGDSDPDVALVASASNGAGTVYIFLNNGVGVLSQAASFPCLNDPRAIAVRDFTGDSRILDPTATDPSPDHLDIAVASNSANAVTVYRRASSLCATPLTWREARPSVPGDAPVPRQFAMAAYDDGFSPSDLSQSGPRRNRLVLFGGYTFFPAPGQSNFLQDTWEWNGSSWSRFSTPAPPPRYSGSMVFDPVRNVTLLFGGYGPGRVIYHDLWSWNGQTWTEVSHAPPSTCAASNTTWPCARYGHTMAFDYARGVVVMHGGHNNPDWEDINYLNDTWEWDGTSWARRSTANSPPPRKDSALAYDSRRNVCVLFGGMINPVTNARLQDTWEYDGNNWVNRTPASGSPALRDSHSFAYDASRGVCVLFGGNGSAELPGVNDALWEWNGNAWTRVPFASPAARWGSKLLYDPAREGLVLFGGRERGATSESNAVWHLARSSITAPPPAVVTRRPGETAEISAAVSSSGPTVIRWRRNGIELSNAGRISGVDTPTLRIASAQPSDEGVYSFSIRTRCGSEIAGSTQLFVRHCAADLDDGSGTGTPDGGVTIEDLLYYLALYAEGRLRADLDDGSGTGTPDGGVTIDDLLYFLTRYDLGC